MLETLVSCSTNLANMLLFSSYFCFCVFFCCPFHISLLHQFKAHKPYPHFSVDFFIYIYIYFVLHKVVITIVGAKESVLPVTKITLALEQRRETCCLMQSIQTYTHPLGVEV